MECPRCNHPNRIDAVDCERCGVVFEKWEARRPQPPIAGERIRVPEPTPPSSQPRFELPMVVLAGIILGGLFLLDLRVDRNEPRQASVTAQEAESSPPADAPPGGADEGFDLAKGLPRLERILEEIQKEAEAYGFTVSMDHLHHWFEKGAEPLPTSVSSYKASLMGISTPQRERFSSADHDGVRKGGKGARCRIDGKWVYTHSLPEGGPEDGVEECWQRLSGTREIARTWDQALMAQGWVDWWERRTWQPRNKRWAPYSETTEQSIRQYIIDEEYGFEAEWKDRESSAKRIAQIEDSPHYSNNPEARISFIKMAILEAHKTQVLRAGARYRLEYEQGP